MKTVFFGPFLGEFGWEMFHWQGWVKKMCQGKYKDCHKIVATYEGREPFYPQADEFWFHPQEIKNLKISERNYIADYWYDNYPKGSGPADKNIGYYADKLLKDYQKKLPADTIFFVPYKLNSYNYNGKNRLFGVLWLPGLAIYQNPKVLSIQGSEEQLFEVLEPTQKAKDFLAKMIDPSKKLICLFPRRRLSRRPDKNWPKEKYDLLIQRLKNKYPNYAVAICGTPQGSYYSDKIPQDCLDLINVPDDLRFNVQVAALGQAVIALGSESGGVHASMLLEKPTLEWGFAEKEKPIKAVNFLKAPLFFWPESNPSVEKIEDLVSLILEGKEINYPQVSNSFNSYQETGNIFKLFFREVLARPVLTHFHKKNLEDGLINSPLLK